MDLKQSDFEKQKWNNYYKEALDGNGQEHQPSLWWKISDDDSVSIVKKYLNPSVHCSILEAGCGSGGSSFYLEHAFKDISITLCDISENALEFARTITPNQLRGNVEYIISDIVCMPFNDDSFDLTWNVGVLEHYTINEILQMAAEMTRVTKIGGYVIIAIPNRRSIATLKAYILGSRFGKLFLFWIPGYRFDSEILYGNRQLKKILFEKFKRDVFVEFAGNMLWVGAPKKWVKKFNSCFPRSSFSFLTFFVFKK